MNNLNKPIEGDEHLKNHVIWGDYKAPKLPTLEEMASPPLVPNMDLTTGGLQMRGDSVVHKRTGMVLSEVGKINPLWQGEGLDLTLLTWALTRMRSPKFGGADYPIHINGETTWRIPRHTMQTPDCIITRMAEDMIAIQKNNEQITICALLITGWNFCQLENFVEKAKALALATGRVRL